MARDPGSSPSAHSPVPVRHLATIVLVMTVGVGSLWIFIDWMSGGGSPGDPSGSETPTAAPAEIAEATPASGEVPPPRPGSLPDLLRYAPDRLGDGGWPLTQFGHYADIAGWMRQAGIPKPAGPGDPALAAWEAELANLAIPASLSERGLDPLWAETYGFSLLDIDQVLVVGHAPDYVIVMRGAFDAATLQRAWVRSGYQSVEVRGTTTWSLFPEDAIDLSSPASRPAMGALNNVTLLPDGTLVSAARTSRIQLALGASDGTSPALAGNEGIASLLAPEDDAEAYVSAILARGDLLEVLPSGSPIAEATPVRDAERSIAGDAATGARTASRILQMPPVDLMVIGVVPERIGAATPATRATMSLRIIMSIDGIDAGRNARDATTRRLAEGVSPVTGTTYLERFGTPRIILRDVPGDRAAVTIDATLRRGVADWLAIIEQRDLGFAMWIGPLDDADGG